MIEAQRAAVNDGGRRAGRERPAASPGRPRLVGVAAAASFALLAFASAASAQDPCMDCHAAQDLDEAQATHLRQHRNSAHAAAGVSCADCHGGNRGTFVELRAHAGVLNSAHPGSPVNHWNLPRTCGRCHGSEFRALQESAHHALVERRIRAAPSCRTCHGSVAAQSLGVEGGLQARCNLCHGAEADHEAASAVSEEGRQALARGGANLTRLRTLGRERAEVSRGVLRLRDPALRHEAANLLFEVNGHWDEAIESGHAFDWEDWERSLEAMAASLAQLRAALDQGGN